MPKQLLFKIKEYLGDVVFQMEERSSKSAYLSVHKSDLRYAASVFFERFNARFLTASAIDNARAFEILYHFSFDSLHKIISIRTFIERKSAVIDSIAPVVGPSAEWIEAEIHELFGIDFAGHTGPKRLLLPEDSPEAEHPFRRKENAV